MLCAQQNAAVIIGRVGCPTSEAQAAEPQDCRTASVDCGCKRQSRWSNGGRDGGVGVGGVASGLIVVERGGLTGGTTGAASGITGTAQSTRQQVMFGTIASAQLYMTIVK